MINDEKASVKKTIENDRKTDTLIVVLYWEVYHFLFDFTYKSNIHFLFVVAAVTRSPVLEMSYSIAVTLKRIFVKRIYCIL